MGAEPPREGGGDPACEVLHEAGPVPDGEWALEVVGEGPELLRPLKSGAPLVVEGGLLLGVEAGECGQSLPAGFGDRVPLPSPEAFSEVRLLSPVTLLPAALPGPQAGRTVLWPAGSRTLSKLLSTVDNCEADIPISLAFTKIDRRSSRTTLSLTC